MKTIKVLLSVTSFCSLWSALFLLWNEDKVTCGLTTAKVFETLFILISILTTKTVAEIRK